MAHDNRFAELPVRTRRTFDGDSAMQCDESVLCPTRGSIDVETCLDCRYCGGPSLERDDALICLHPAARRPERPARAVRMPSAAELTALTDIMTKDVVCVRSDVSLDGLGTLLLERNISAVPVVDASGRPVGVASKTDMLRWFHDEMATGTADRAVDGPEPGMTTREIPRATVADIMMSMAFTLTEDAPVAYAAALMAVEGVHHLPIVTGDGKVVGIVSALDIVRWLAHHDGFVVPAVK